MVRRGYLRQTQHYFVPDEIHKLDSGARTWPRRGIHRTDHDTGACLTLPFVFKPRLADLHAPAYPKARQTLFCSSCCACAVHLCGRGGIDAPCRKGHSPFLHAAPCQFNAPYRYLLIRALVLLLQARPKECLAIYLSASSSSCSAALTVQSRLARMDLQTVSAHCLLFC